MNGKTFVLMIVMLFAGLIVGYFVGTMVIQAQVLALQSQVLDLQDQLADKDSELTYLSQQTQKNIRAQIVYWAGYKGDIVRPEILVRNIGVGSVNITSISIKLKTSDEKEPWYTDKSCTCILGHPKSEGRFVWSEVNASAPPDFIVSYKWYLIRVNTSTDYFYEFVVYTDF